MNDIYVILIDGFPYLKERAIRTYMTRERAVKEARSMLAYYAKYQRGDVNKKYEVARFGTYEPEEVLAN